MIHNKRDISGLKFCNCAGCNRELLGQCHAEWYAQCTTQRLRSLGIYAIVYCRKDDRPYCKICTETRFKVRTYNS